MKFSPLGEARFRFWFEQNHLVGDGLSRAPLQESALAHFTERGIDEPFVYVRKNGITEVPPFVVGVDDFMPPVVLGASVDFEAAVNYVLDTPSVQAALNYVARAWLYGDSSVRRRLEVAFEPEFKRYAALAAGSK